VAPLFGAPGARGPRFIEPPEPPVPTPLDHFLATYYAQIGHFISLYTAGPEVNVLVPTTSTIFRK